MALSEPKDTKATPKETTKDTHAPGTAATGITTLAEKVKALRKRTGLGLRRIEPINDLMGISPNKVDSKPPEPMMLRPEELWVDASYQRDLSRSSTKLILRIIEGWDWRKFKSPIVTLDAESRYVVIDGQHTSIAAATHPDIARIPVMFVAMVDVMHQAQAFVSHNTARVRVTDLDLFHADVTGGDEMAVEINRIIGEVGIGLARYVPGAAGLYEQNQTVSVGVMKNMYRRYGPLRFEAIMRVLAQCGFTPIRADHIRAVAILLYDREDGSAPISADFLIQVIVSLNDADAQHNAAKIAATTKQTKARALAQVYRNAYDQHFGKKR